MDIACGCGNCGGFGGGVGVCVGGVSVVGGCVTYLKTEKYW